MKVINAWNVNDALTQGLHYLAAVGRQQGSRNGAVLVAPTPVCTVYAQPTQRVLFSPLRDANPFFHYLESMWMLAGRNDAAFPAHYAAQINQYSDDGETLNGAYGHRWCEHFGYDQLPVIIEELKKNPQSRRCVLAMWDAGSLDDESPTREHDIDFVEGDLHKAMNGSKDVPCNTHAYFDASNGELNMTVCCRSNDAIWGAYGANAVHFSILLEYVAAAIGIPVGKYYQISNNYHIYLGRPDVERLIEVTDKYKTVKMPHGSDTDAYMTGVRSTPLFNNVDVFDEQLAGLFNAWNVGSIADIDFMSDMRSDLEPAIDTAVYMINAHRFYKNGDLEAALNVANEILHADWRLACTQWLLRRQEKRNAKAA